jgi:hypothetical protein
MAGYCGIEHAHEDWATHAARCNVAETQNPNAIWTTEEEIGQSMGEAQEQWQAVDMVHTYEGQSVVNKDVCAISGEAAFKTEKGALYRGNTQLPRGGAHWRETVEMYVNVEGEEIVIPGIKLPQRANVGFGFNRGYNVYLNKKDIDATRKFPMVSLAGHIAVGLGTADQKSLIWGNYVVGSSKTSAKRRSWWEMFRSGIATTLALPKMVRIRAFDNITHMQVSITLEQDTGTRRAVARGDVEKSDVLYAISYIEVYVPSSHVGGHSASESWATVYAQELQKNVLPAKVNASFIDAAELQDIAVLNDMLDGLGHEDLQDALSRYEDQHPHVDAELSGVVKEGEEALLKNLTQDILDQFQEAIDNFHVDSGSSSSSIGSDLMDRFQQAVQAKQMLAVGFSPAAIAAHSIDVECPEDAVALIDVLGEIQDSLKAECINADMTLDHVQLKELENTQEEISRLRNVLHQHVDNLYADELGIEGRVYDEIPLEVRHAIRQAEGISISLYGRLKKKIDRQRAKNAALRSMKEVDSEALVAKFIAQVDDAEAKRAAGKNATDSINLAFRMEAEIDQRSNKGLLTFASYTELPDAVARLENLKSTQRGTAYDKFTKGILSARENRAARRATRGGR